MAWRLAPEARSGTKGGRSRSNRFAPCKEGLSLAEAGRRVVTIVPADAMNRFTANALLKVLEEPPAGVSFLLVTDSPSAVADGAQPLPGLVDRAAAADLALAWLETQEGGAQAAPL